MVIAVAIDENTEAIRGFTDGITYPVLMDPDHLLTEIYAISNVPTVIWIDADDSIIRPNSVAISTNTFSDFTSLQLTSAEGKCSKPELVALECIEYYGMKQGVKLCRDYYDDFIECVKSPVTVRQFFMLYSMHSRSEENLYKLFRLRAILITKIRQ